MFHFSGCLCWWHGFDVWTQQLSKWNEVTHSCFGLNDFNSTEIASFYMKEWGIYICLGILRNILSAYMEYSPVLISAMFPGICCPIINTWRHYLMSSESRVPRHTASNICDICHTTFLAWSVRYSADSKVVFSTVVSSFRSCIIRTTYFSIHTWNKKRHNYHHYFPAVFPRAQKQNSPASHRIVHQQTIPSET